MTLRNLYFFSEIVKDMRLSDTAERLYTSQQALSGHIQRLESHFGVRLFERCPNLVLTKEGKLLAEEATVILNAERRLFVAYGTGMKKRRGALTIVCGFGRSSSYLTDVLRRFSERYPEVEVSCIAENLYKSDSMFSDGAVDLAISHGMSRIPNIRHITLYRTSSVLVVSRSLLKKHLSGSAEEFIERASARGVELSDMPRSIPVYVAGVYGQEHWMCDHDPVMREFTVVQIAPGRTEGSFDVSCLKRGMTIISDVFSRNIHESIPEEKLRDILFFRQLKDGKPILMDEELGYDANRVHPQYFFDFIEILYDEIKKKGLCDGTAAQ